MWIVAFAVYIRFIFFNGFFFRQSLFLFRHNIQTDTRGATVARFRTLWIRRFIFGKYEKALALNVAPQSQSVYRNDFPLTDWARLHSLDGWLTAFASCWARSVRHVDTAHKWILPADCCCWMRELKNCWFCLTRSKIRPFATTDRSKLTDGARLHKCFIAWTE